jgi:hypothetical protein
LRSSPENWGRRCGAVGIFFFLEIEEELSVERKLHLGRFLQSKT